MDIWEVISTSAGSKFFLSLDQLVPNRQKSLQNLAQHFRQIFGWLQSFSYYWVFAQRLGLKIGPLGNVSVLRATKGRVSRWSAFREGRGKVKLGLKTLVIWLNIPKYFISNLSLLTFNVIVLYLLSLFWLWRATSFSFSINYLTFNHIILTSKLKILTLCYYSTHATNSTIRQELMNFTNRDESWKFANFWSKS